MKKAYKILRFLLVSLLALAVGIPIILYLIVSLPPVQHKLKEIAESELTALLNSPVKIGDVALAPFTRVTVSDVAVLDADADTALRVETLGAGLSMTQLLTNRRLVVTHVELLGASLHVRRATPDSPLNIQPIIDALNPKRDQKTRTRFSLAVHTLVIRRMGATFDVASAPPPDAGKFCRDHMAIADLRADITAPEISDSRYHIKLKRMSVTERSGLEVTNMRAEILFTPTRLDIIGTTIELPRSSLMLTDLHLRYGAPGEIPEVLRREAREFGLIRGSHVTPADLAPFVPQLGQLRAPVGIELTASGTADSLAINKMELAVSGTRTWLSCSGSIDSLLSATGSKVTFNRLRFNARGREIDSTLSAFTPVSHNTRRLLASLDTISLEGSAHASRTSVGFTGSLSTSAGSFELDFNSRKRGANTNLIAGSLTTPGLDLGRITDNNDLGNAAFDITVDAVIAGRHRRQGSAACTIDEATFRGHRYSQIAANFQFDGDTYSGDISIDDPAASLQAEGLLTLADTFAIDAHILADRIDPMALGLWNKYPDYTLSADIEADFTGNTIDTADGHVTVSGVSFTLPDNTGLHLNPIRVDASNSTEPQLLTLSSDLIDGRVEGSFDFTTLSKSFTSILAATFPSLISAPEPMSTHNRTNDFTWTLTIKDNNDLTDFFATPVRLLYPVKADGSVCETDRRATLHAHAPYIQQKDKLIRNTRFDMLITPEAESSLTATTTIPGKHGDMTLNFDASAVSDDLSAAISWKVDNQRRFDGAIGMNARFSRSVTGTTDIQADLLPGSATFNDTTWTVDPARITITDRRITVDNVNAHRENQSIRIDGTASADSLDLLTVSLADINLDYVFETLNISDAVMFGGSASGTIYASGLMTPAPTVTIPELNVKRLSYNHSLMGDTRIESHWDNDRKAVTIDAVVDQPNNRQSLINGAIFVLADSLEFNFNADKAGVGFLQPFMAAFADEVSGYASGQARLWGNFKYIDMTGKFYADDFKVKLGFSGVTYSATDSVDLKPGLIDIRDLTLRDPLGNTAKLNGTVRHSFFKAPVFDFHISEARNLLAYDIGPNIYHPWYGHIFANGSASVTGKPGIVNIACNLTTAPKSTFTFVLSDAEEADDYTFITFRDRNRAKIADATQLAVGSPELDQVMLDKIRNHQEAESATDYNMNFNVDINNDAQVNLVMDPVGGDKIVSYGSGHMNMIYESANEAFKMFGTYTLNRGDYNFTLQDIIIKNFTISDGSSIAFHGDPYSAQLDIRAIYSLMANLSDLDESFLTDKELNRTNVPVNAVLLVDGDMRQPDISFDLDFPTLQSDTYRKVRSIVSTDEMMNRQIIYLLALNRFYTPDYMASTTKGSELMSVASSTISSQLGSILGQLSDKFTVAPNLRTDAGDFSDVQFDVALSSTLLNNRLLLNGNLGYRDNALNENQFIGDFDIEYLLNRSGNVRLKAYNRYNDRNYYVKTALTTQGLGIVFRRDFDNMTSFLRKFRKKKDSKPATQTDKKQ